MTQDMLPLDVPEAPGPLPPTGFAEPAETILYTVAGSPIGKMLLTSDGASLTALWMEPPGGGPLPIRGEWRHDPGWFAEAERQLGAYFAGDLREFTVPLAPHGTAFQRLVWRELTTIPYGRTTSYGAIAKAIGHPNGSRAVGLTNGRNPISVIVPCHRVIGANGALVGYGGGLPRKRHLLHLERTARRPA
ncbi:methylated-DNA--[protein]-cysteine S-methyltransferase [Nocardiopsis mangrovi]|uniref:Methylated-DNA--protein-cysteine methyltransferase n=1 Tax=Nocardiopsis mangrovi TaxID=1179818 RepID=A0ABV9E7W3_9ACTN